MTVPRSNTSPSGATVLCVRSSPDAPRAGSALVGAALGIGMSQDALTADLVVQGVEAMAGWDLHPLESAALPRRTPEAEVGHALCKADQDRRQRGPVQWAPHIPACRDGGSTAVVRGDPATDRRPAAEAGDDMTPGVIAAELNPAGDRSPRTAPGRAST